MFYLFLYPPAWNITGVQYTFDKYMNEYSEMKLISLEHLLVNGTNRTQFNRRLLNVLYETGYLVRCPGGEDGGT